MNELNFYESERDNDDKIYFCFAVNTEAIWHYHRSLEIVAVTEGTFDIQINHNAYAAKKGDLFLIPPYCHHSIKPKQSKSVTIIVPPNLLGEYYSFYQKRHDFLLGETDFNETEIFPIIFTAGKFDNTLTRHGLFDMIIGIIAHHYRSTKDIYPQNDFIARTIGFLQKNYTEQISLGEISNHLGYSKYYFSKLFNSYMKCSFENYLVSLRLQKFIEQLKPDTNITKLAFDCGFESISSFYRNFKSTYGTTPKQMQKNLQKT